MTRELRHFLFKVENSKGSFSREAEGEEMRTLSQPPHTQESNRLCLESRAGHRGTHLCCQDLGGASGVQKQPQ